MTLAGLSLRTRGEYEQATSAEAGLRVVIDTMPAWLYDASELGQIVDDLNRARADYERCHPDEPKIEPTVAESGIEQYQRESR